MRAVRRLDTLSKKWVRMCSSTSSITSSKVPHGSTTCTINSLPLDKGIAEIRQQIAPWIGIGSYDRGLLSHLSTWDILRALSVLRLCSYDALVSNSLKMLELSRKFGPLGSGLLRMTFFDQFVGGDKVPRMTEVVDSMQKRGVSLMMCPVLEEDVEDEEASTKTYEENLETLLNLTTMTAALEKKKPMIQLKPTAIMSANVLERVSRAIEQHVGNDRKKYASLITAITQSVDRPEELPILKSSLKEKKQFLDGFRRADAFVKFAHDLKVHVVVDAEFYACRPAIAIVALALMARYNGKYHIVGNTVQGYMKDAVSIIENELKVVTDDIGVNWYGKIVRGAYMDRERYLAKKHGYSSPICNTYEATNASYNRAVSVVLDHIQKSPKRHSHLIVASHNEVSIRLAAHTMKAMGLAPTDDRVSFGQVYGMSDYLTTPIVKQGFQVYKSTPFGSMDKVLPYLARRASENRSVMKGTREEREMLWKELKSRFGLG